MQNLIIISLKNATKSLSSNDLVEIMDVNKRTLQKHLKKLIEDKQIIAEGKGKARRYRLPSKTNFTKGIPIGWNEKFLTEYIPNTTFYLSEKIRNELLEIGSPISTLPAGTYARRILDRLLIDLSWNSSRLEGNTYTLLDTEELISGSKVDGRSDLETQMILNHKDAIEFLVEGADENTFNPFTIRSLHGILSENLLSDPASSGALRCIPVGITKSSYIPLADPQRIESAFETICDIAERIQNPFEASLFVLIQIPYLQPFVDVNKRVSRLAANIPFIRNNHHPLSFIDTDLDAYLYAILQIYEFQNVIPITELFVSAYHRSAEKYAVISQSLGQPDPFRLKYRNQLKEAVVMAVRNLIHKSDLGTLEKSVDVDMNEADFRKFVQTVSEELHTLHEGNIARYRLRPSEFHRWENSFEQKKT